jgi:hypothetical protein
LPRKAFSSPLGHAPGLGFPSRHGAAEIAKLVGNAMRSREFMNSCGHAAPGFLPNVGGTRTHLLATARPIREARTYPSRGPGFCSAEARPRRNGIARMPRGQPATIRHNIGSHCNPEACLHSASRDYAKGTCPQGFCAACPPAETVRSKCPILRFHCEFLPSCNEQSPCHDLDY